MDQHLLDNALEYQGLTHTVSLFWVLNRVAAFSPNGGSLVVGMHDGTCEVFRLYHQEQDSRLDFLIKVCKALKRIGPMFPSR